MNNHASHRLQTKFTVALHSGFCCLLKPGLRLAQNKQFWETETIPHCACLEQQKNKTTKTDPSYVTCKTIEDYMTHHVAKEASRDLQPPRSPKKKITAESWHGGCLLRRAAITICMYGWMILKNRSLHLWGKFYFFILLGLENET